MPERDFRQGAVPANSARKWFRRDGAGEFDPGAALSPFGRSAGVRNSAAPGLSSARCIDMCLA
jgi:hypothetical protein